MRRDLKGIHIHGCRCKERLKAKTEGSTRLAWSSVEYKRNKGGKKQNQRKIIFDYNLRFFFYFCNPTHPLFPLLRFGAWCVQLFCDQETQKEKREHKLLHELREGRWKRVKTRKRRAKRRRSAVLAWICKIPGPYTKWTIQQRGSNNKKWTPPTTTEGNRSSIGKDTVKQRSRNDKCDEIAKSQLNCGIKSVEWEQNQWWTLELGTALHTTN